MRFLLGSEGLVVVRAVSKIPFMLQIPLHGARCIQPDKTQVPNFFRFFQCAIAPSDLFPTSRVGHFTSTLGEGVGWAVFSPRRRTMSTLQSHRTPHAANTPMYVHTTIHFTENSTQEYSYSLRFILSKGHPTSVPVVRRRKTSVACCLLKC